MDLGAGENVNIGSSNAYFIKPESSIKIAAGIILLHDTRGYDIPYTFRFADHLAEQGYKVLVPNLNTAFNSSLGLVKGIIQNSLLYLQQEEGIQNVGSVGLGWGGEIAMLLATNKLVQCCISVCPKDFWIRDGEMVVSPILFIFGNHEGYMESEKMKQLRAFAAEDSKNRVPVILQEHDGFCYDNIADEDAASQAMAEILDWLRIFLKKFKVAACTSDSDPWWPQGKNGPFYNKGFASWQNIRASWKQAQCAAHKRASSPLVGTSAIVKDLSSMSRTLDLQGSMRLSDITDILNDIWDR